MSLFRSIAAGVVLSCSAQFAAAEAVRLPAIVGATELVGSDPLSALALSGYDPVGYFLDGTARPGLRDHEVTVAGLAWRFATAANRHAFLRDADAFTPRIGGYDPVAASLGRVVDADPTLFAVRGGRLYLFRSEQSRRIFLDDRGLAERAEIGWAGLRPGLVAE